MPGVIINTVGPKTWQDIFLLSGRDYQVRLRSKLPKTRDIPVYEWKIPLTGWISVEEMIEIRLMFPDVTITELPDSEE